jgi:hypothetical protein
MGDVVSRHDTTLQKRTGAHGYMAATAPRRPGPPHAGRAPKVRTHPKRFEKPRPVACRTLRTCTSVPRRAIRRLSRPHPDTPAGSPRPPSLSSTRGGLAIKPSRAAPRACTRPCHLPELRRSPLALPRWARLLACSQGRLATWAPPIGPTRAPALACCPGPAASSPE